jgi:AcrR family transcriptional regulator
MDRAVDSQSIQSIELPGTVAVPAWRQRRRNRILAAATELFANRPYPLVSMDDVADTAHMGKATLYRYFPSKEDLYVAVFDLLLDELGARLDEAIALGGGASAMLKRMIAILAPALGEHFRGLRTIDDAVMHAAERKRRLFRNRRQVITSHIEDAIIAGIESGEFRPVQATICAQMIVGMIWSSSVSTSESPETVAQAVSDLFLNGALAMPKPGQGTI